MSIILVSDCGSCGDSRVPVLRTWLGGQPQNDCKVCDPDGFETQARMDIEAWLRGDPTADQRLGYAP